MSITSAGGCLFLNRLKHIKYVGSKHSCDWLITAELGNSNKELQSRGVLSSDPWETLENVKIPAVGNAFPNIIRGKLIAEIQDFFAIL